MRTCRWCAEVVDPGDTTCPHCGNRLARPIDPRRLHPPPSRQARLWTVAAGLALVAAGIWYQRTAPIEATRPPVASFPSTEAIEGAAASTRLQVHIITATPEVCWEGWLGWDAPAGGSHDEVEGCGRETFASDGATGVELRIRHANWEQEYKPFVVNLSWGGEHAYASQTSFAEIFIQWSSTVEHEEPRFRVKTATKHCSPVTAYAEGGHQLECVPRGESIMATRQGFPFGLGGVVVCCPSGFRGYGFVGDEDWIDE